MNVHRLWRLRASLVSYRRPNGASSVSNQPTSAQGGSSSAKEPSRERPHSDPDNPQRQRRQNSGLSVETTFPLVSRRYCGLGHTLLCASMGDKRSGQSLYSDVHSHTCCLRTRGQIGQQQRLKLEQFNGFQWACILILLKYIYYMKIS